jgi:hypothetical protein
VRAVTVLFATWLLATCATAPPNGDFSLNAMASVIDRDAIT